MQVGGISSSAGLATKVSQRLGKLAASMDKTAAKIASHPNAGQLKKAQRLLDRAAGGNLLGKAGSEDLIRMAASEGNSLNWGQAINRLRQGWTPPAPPTTPPDTTTPPTTEEPPTTSEPPVTTEPPLSSTEPPADDAPVGATLDVVA